MTPYYDDGATAIYHGDCLDVLADLRPEVAAVFMDPPYGIAYGALRDRSDPRPIAGDQSMDAAAGLIAGALKLIRAEAYFVCCDWRSLPTVAAAMQRGGVTPKACIVWDKVRRIQNLDRYAKQHEFILYSGPYGGEPTVATDVWRVRRDVVTEHPTPKPVGLPITAMLTATRPGDLVLDPFMGSGTTLRAAKDCGRRAIGIEVDRAYCELAVRRLRQEALDLGGAA